MVVEIKKKTVNDKFTKYYFNIGKTEITLSKKALEWLKNNPLDSSHRMEITGDFILTASTTTKGSKTYTNYWLTISQAQNEQPSKTEPDSDLPF